jgi:uncharacterized protein (DUF1330 family)
MASRQQKRIGHYVNSIDRADQTVKALHNDFIAGKLSINCKTMIYITQLIYIIEGQEKVFDQFENIAIPIITKYNGRLLFRVRPGDNAYIEHQIDKPYEIHLVEFDTETDFEKFKEDEERKKFLHLKEQSIKASILIVGQANSAFNR